MLNRRDFLRTLAATTSALMVAPHAFANDAPATPTDKLGDTLPLRKLGNSGASVTMLGLGGWHVGRFSEADAQRVIEVALEGGIRFFDTAESYQNGESERRYGKFLVPRYREHAYIMSKSTAPNATVARDHLEGTLRRLNVDQLDLWQIHSLTSPRDADNRVEHGVLDVVLKAKEEGKVKHVGLTGHASPEALSRMLELTDALQTCQMPINVLDPSYKSFIDGVLPQLVEKQVGVLAMKTLANGFMLQPQTSKADGVEKPAVIPGRLSLEEALHFVWSLPVSVLITGPDSLEQLRQNIAIARGFVALSAEQRQTLIRQAADLAGPEFEYYKI